MRRRLLILLLALLFALLLVALLAPTALAYNLSVPVWDQGDPHWGALHLGTSSYTMAGSGCAVTSAAMVAAYFGSLKNPGQLCTALNADGGLDSSGDLSWSKVPAAAGGSITYVATYNTCDLTRINQELDSGDPVIVKVHLSGSTHFVVLTGRDGATYYINDPAGGVRTTLNARYGSPSTAIFGFRVFHGVHATSTPIRYEQTDADIVKTGTWTNFSKAQASGGNYGRSSTAGASAAITFTGTRLDWIAMKGTTPGIADVYLDGKEVATIDLSASTASYQVDVWSSGTLSSGQHVVKLVRDSSSASGKYLTLDAVDIWGTMTS